MNTDEIDDIEDDEEEDEEQGYNRPTVYVDGESFESSYDEVERVQVSFSDAENGYQTDADRKASLGWVNSAAITLDYESDDVTLSISVGDPRGAFAFRVHRTQDGKLILFTPSPDDGLLHRPLKKLREGVYEIG